MKFYGTTCLRVHSNREAPIEKRAA